MTNETKQRRMLASSARVEWNLLVGKKINVSNEPENRHACFNSECQPAHLTKSRKSLFARVIQRLCSFRSLVFVRNRKKFGPSISSMREIM